MNAARPVYIHRTGHASALGLSTAAAAASQLAGQPALAERELLGMRYPWFALPLAEQEWDARVRRALDLVAAELAADRALPLPADLPLFIGSSSLQAGALEAHARATGAVDFSPDPADMGAKVSAAFGVASTPWMFSTGCSSGLAALEAAFTLIAQGEIDTALALGFEFANDITLAGFASLGLLARTEADDGLMLGEAVAGLLLTARPGSGWRIAACRLGIDGYSPTAPTPDGRVIAANLTATLDDAGLEARDIDLIKPHQGRVPGTDAAEEAALARLFGSRRPPEITFKRQLGHTLGASGPVELTLLLALLDTPAGKARYGQPRRLLFNLVGFGGSIAALVLERCGETGKPT